MLILLEMFILGNCSNLREIFVHFPKKDKDVLSTLALAVTMGKKN